MPTPLRVSVLQGQDGFLGSEPQASPRLPRDWHTWCLISPALSPLCLPPWQLVPGVPLPPAASGEGGHLSGRLAAPRDPRCSRLASEETVSPESLCQTQYKRDDGGLPGHSPPTGLPAAATTPTPHPAPAPPLPLRNWVSKEHSLKTTGVCPVVWFNLCFY